jgi:hypothetical protein
MGLGFSTPKEQEFFDTFQSLSDAITKESVPQRNFDEHDDFRFEVDGISHVYRPRFYKLFRDGLLVEKNSPEMIILSLLSYGIHKFSHQASSSIYRFHLTLVRKTFDESGEFHVSVEKLVKSSSGKIVSTKECSDFYRISGPTFVQVKSKSKRKTCDHLKKISIQHAGTFQKSTVKTATLKL